MKIYWQHLLLALVIAGCSTKAEQKDVVKINEVPVVRLEEKDTILQQTYVADVEAVKNVEIRARIGGFLEKIHVDEGKRVKKGQVLFSISNRELQNDLTRAKANLEKATAAARIAQVELQRIQSLVNKKVISASELDLGKARLSQARARIAEARAEIADARTKINYTAVRSPFNGIIDRIPLKIGSLINDGTLLTTIFDDNQMFAYFNVTENEYLQFKKSTNGKFTSNKEATLVLSDGSVYPYKGKIETQEAEFSNNTGSIAFRARFPNPNYLIKHGSSGNVKLTSPLTGVILVPQKSVMEIQDQSFVFVLEKNNTVKMKAFVPGIRLTEWVTVKSGLQPGEAIVYEGIQNIKDGSQIEPKYNGVQKSVAAK